MSLSLIYAQILCWRGIAPIVADVNMSHFIPMKSLLSGLFLKRKLLFWLCIFTFNKVVIDEEK